MLRSFRQLLASSNRLPDAVLVELVGIVYSGLPPIVVMGVATACMGTLVAVKTGDALVIALVIVGLLIMFVRAMMFIAYDRARPAAHDAAAAKIWERRYAIGSYSFSILLGLLNIRAMMFGDPLIAMLLTGLIFGYGAGLVTRLAARPVLCVTSLALSVTPTVLGLGFYIASAQDSYSMLAYFAQATLIAGFAVTSLETVAHFYKTTLQQLLTKQDLVIMAGQDALTGLPNRALLQARLHEGITQLREKDDLLACHYLDLDLFKEVNDKLGHAAGDVVLQSVAERLRSMLRVGDTAARIGGDEFVILQVGIRSPDEARLLAHRLIRAVSAPYPHAGGEIRIGVSVGIALAPRDGTDLQRLTSCADAALYQAKRRGRGSVMISGDPLPADAAASAA